MPAPFSALCITGPKNRLIVDSQSDTITMPKPFVWGAAMWGDQWGSKTLTFRFFEISFGTTTIEPAFWIPQEEFDKGPNSARQFVLKELTDQYQLPF